MYRLAASYLLGDGDVAGLRLGPTVLQPLTSSDGGPSMAHNDAADFQELSPEDAQTAIVWRPSPDRRRLVRRWTLRCLVAVAVLAGAWSLRDRYPRVDLSGTRPAKQV